MHIDVFHVFITSVVLIGIFYAFIKEQIPADLAALTAMAVLLVTGVISTNDALTVFSNPAPITIACMFIMSAALERTGVVDALGAYALNLAKTSRLLAMIWLIGGVMLVSAFMNNTPVVMVMAPVVISVAQKLREYPSKFLIPLSYAAILGGTCTLIGTSTNILVDGVAQAHGQAPFTMFEMSMPGLFMALAGLVFMLTIGRNLLPERKLLQEELIDSATRKRFIAEAMISANSPLIGRTLNDVQFTLSEDHEIIDLVRNQQGSRTYSSTFARLIESFNAPRTEPDIGYVSPLRDIPLLAGDRLVFKTHKNELMELRKFIGISFDTELSHVSDPVLTQESILTEAVVEPTSPMIGKRVTELRLRRRYGCYVLAVYRDTLNITGNFDQIVIRPGDVLLLEGPEYAQDFLFEQEGLKHLTHISHKPFDAQKAPLAIFAIIAVVTLAAINVMPIAGLAIVGATFVILSGCISHQKAYEAIDWSVLLLIFGMLAVSLAMENTGVAKAIVEFLASLVSNMGPLAVLAMVYALTSLLTELMSNNASAVILTPIAIALADSLGVDARPFVVAVMFAASASFATPIGYQTNTFVYRAGNYQFNDFLKIGVAMNIIVFVIAMIVIPIYWPL